MPVAHANGIDLYYEVHGEGPHLTLVEGLGYHTWMWYKQLPALSRHFQTLIYDNRGVGRSDKPPGPYTHEQNADDLAALLDHLEWERTHLLGVSMGGFIAQEFALKYPDCLDKLVLVATHFGGPNKLPEAVDVLWYFLPHSDVTPLEVAQKALAVTFADPMWAQKHPEEAIEMAQRRSALPPAPIHAVVAQNQAGKAFNVEGRLREVTAPTLVIAGREDAVVPPRNAELLAAAIPNARLDVIPDASHLVFIEQAERFNRDVTDFLLEGT
jgi:pimeloyl-ACP methyl ester carboxylesterase